MPVSALEHPFFRLVQVLLLLAAILFALNQLDLLDTGPPELRVVRITGEDPITAAATAARESYGGGADTVIVVGVDALADGVVATGLAGALGAPILLNEVERLSPQTRDIIRELDPTAAILIGGTGAMRTVVETALRDDMDLETMRIAGASRFDTASLAADRFVQGSPPGLLDGRRTALVVPSEDVAAGLAAGGLAAVRGSALPVVYSQDGVLPEPSRTALRRMGIEQVVAVGGVGGFGGDVVTVLGPVDTADTAARLRGFAASRVVVVPDADDARALVGAPVAGLEAGVILPLRDAPSWLAGACGTIAELFVIAEDEVVSEQQVADLVTAATVCPEG